MCPERQVDCHFRRNTLPQKAAYILFLLLGSFVAEAKPNAADVIKARLNELKLCAVQDFAEVELDPDRTISLEADAPLRVIRGDALSMNDVDIEDQGRTLEIEFRSKHTHGENADVLVRLFRAIARYKRILLPKWEEDLLSALRPIAVPCESEPVVLQAGDTE